MTKKHRQEALAQEARDKVRKPLTQKQIEKIYYSVPLNTGNFWWDFARAVERAHGIGVKDESD